jgi:peroxiredoxin
MRVLGSALACGGLVAGLAAAAAGEPAARPRPWLGVGISDQGVRWGGVALTEVHDDTPASLCGLRAGDEVVALDRTEVGHAGGLQSAIGARQVGDRVRVVYVRGTVLRRCTTRLAAQITDRTELLHRSLVDRPVPRFAVARRDGTVIDEDAARGRVLVLAMFATSCEPCADTIAELDLRIADAGVTVLAATADGRDALDAYVQRLGLAVPAGVEEAGLAARILRRYAGMPDEVAILVVDHKGVVRFAASGAGPESTHLDGAAHWAARAGRLRRDAR